jgi:ferredoxin/flavodoxin
VGEAIAAGLRAADYEIDLYNISTDPPRGLDGYDLLGIGTPAYYYRPPFNVMDYVRGLPSLEGLATFSFVLHGTYPGDAGNELRHTLAQKGGREVGYWTCRGADFFLGYLKEGYLFAADHPTREELAQAEAFGRSVTGRMAGQAYDRPQDDPAPGLVYRVERLLLHRWLVKQMYSRLFRVNRTQCTACGLCVKQCPTRNITTDGAGYPTWGRDCLPCLHCELKCPQEAITSPASWPLFRPIMMYNVYQAARDPGIEHVRVEHSEGRTRRV